MTDPVDAAIDAALQQPAIAVFPIPICQEGYEIGPGGGLNFNHLDDPAAGQPRVLILDPKLSAWRPVTLAPGDWRLGPADEQPKPKIWTP